MTRTTCSRYDRETNSRAALVARDDRPAALVAAGWVEDGADAWHRPTEPAVTFSQAAALREMLREVTS